MIFCGCLSFQEKNKIQGYFKVTAPSGLILRNGPGQQFERITNLPRGTTGNILKFVGEQVEISGYKGKWLEVYVNDRAGYIFSGHVLYSNSSTTFTRRFNEYSSSSYEAFAIQPFRQISSKNKIQSMLVKENNEYYTGDDNFLFKKLIAYPEGELFDAGFSSDYSTHTIYKKNKAGELIIPDEKNFHVSGIFEQGRLIEGNIQYCYGCCAMPEPAVSIIGVQKSITLYASATDTTPYCFIESGSIDYNKIRISDADNEIYIHKKLGDCSEKVIEQCISKNNTENCIPPKFISEVFVIIKDPYNDPVFETYENQGIPEKFITKFKAARKTKPFKK